MSAWQVNAIGWCSVLLLFTTMAGQAWKQWSECTTKGIGRWFFVGQIAASIGFICYSALQGDAVFVAGNSLVLLAAVSGGAILWWNRTHRAATHASTASR